MRKAGKLKLRSRHVVTNLVVRLETEMDVVYGSVSNC
jgi:hypothetical protein